MPVGIGEPLFDALDADLAKALFGFRSERRRVRRRFQSGRTEVHENNDAFLFKNGKVATSTDNAGGILGGLSSGMPIMIRAAIKPTPSIAKEQKTVNLSTMKNCNFKR